MNMTVTERDKKLLGFLAAFMVALLFFVAVFRPLSAKNKELDQEVAKMQELQAEYGDKALGAQDMVAKEKSTSQQLQDVLARFYPMLQSQDAEKMITTLMLNHGLAVQSLTVTMPEIESDVKWYQYSNDAKQQGEATEQGEEKLLSLYAAKITCVAEGDEKQLWNLIDDISANYPAISISSAEWSVSEKPVAVSQSTLADETDGMESESTGETVKTNRLTISFEIYMCNQ